VRAAAEQAPGLSGQLRGARAPGYGTAVLNSQPKLQPKLQIDIWSDIACPWCYIGKRHLEQALDQFAHKDEVEIVWRAFELDPSAPRTRNDQSYAELVGKKMGMRKEQAQQQIDQLVALAARDGLDFRFDRIRTGNTFDAHRLVHLGHERGVQGAVKERLLRAYMTEGQAIGNHDVLVALAREVGLDEKEAREMLSSDRYAAEVRRDQARAREVGVSGVPFFLLAGRIGVSGAQPAKALLGALDKAWSEQPRPAVETYAEGAVCGPEGCD
jgi:predicted DsbA family dithiol-disulfide isomerase